MSGMVQIREIDFANVLDVAKWNVFVDNHPEGTVFHLTKWGKAISAGLGHKTYYVAAFRGNDIVGLLPLICINSFLFGKSLSSSAFAVYGGPLADSKDVHMALDAYAWKIATDAGISVLEYRNQTRQRPEWHAKTETYATFRREMSDTAEKRLTDIPRKQRAEVRKSFDKNLTVKIENNAHSHFKVYAESVRNLGTPVFPKKLFSALIASYGDDADVLLVEKEGTPTASVLSLYYKNEVFPYYGGGTASARELRANDHMYYSLMNHAWEKGCTRFDFGRSKYGTGAFAFKKNWGFEPEALSYEYRLADGAVVPDLNPLNPKYQLMVKTWQRLPLVIANMAGPFIARNLG
jgi:FemAB-related protein (PEP-CTERM system-associated)